MNHILQTTLLLSLGAFYFFLPQDLVADFVPIVGKLDDFAFLLFLIFQSKKTIVHSCGKQEKPCPEVDSRFYSKTPHQVLELKPNASLADVKNAYRRLVRLYHPDKVNHLGEEIKSVANRRIIEIQRAYEELTRPGAA